MRPCSSAERRRTPEPVRDRVEPDDARARTRPLPRAEDLPHVFDRFWRAEKSRSRQTGGSGLGLSIVRKLVEAHGGTVEARSILGAGSTFILRLPPAPPASDGATP